MFHGGIAVRGALNQLRNFVGSQICKKASRRGAQWGAGKFLRWRAELALGQGAGRSACLCFPVNKLRRSSMPGVVGSPLRRCDFSFPSWQRGSET